MGFFPAYVKFLNMANEEVAVLGGGCFWCLAAVFDGLTGVESVESGYMGGQIENPAYEQVCSGTTGHVEVVRVTFNPKELSYGDLLDVFFTIHDPTTLNRQGNDVGTQYRSVIFYTSENQRTEAEKTISKLQAAHAWPNSIVTAVEPAGKFFLAEDYHQEYYANNRFQPYCQFVVAPKVKKFQQKFRERMKA
jgi:peptide-methionine (S)-S-oxide reductase